MTAYETRAASEDEQDRLALLHRYEVVDSSGRRVVRLRSRLCDYLARARGKDSVGQDTLQA